MLSYLPSLLTVAFIILKLTGYINWSWWVVLSPVWAVLALLLVGFLIQFVFVALINRDRRSRGL